VQESNLLGCDPVGGLAGRSLTGRPTLQLSRRALYGIRTRDLLLDGEASTPLDRQDRRTRRGIRTPNLRLLTTAPLPFGLPGQGSGVYPGAWTTSVSNRTRAACKAALHTCASPLMYHVPAAGFEPATSRLSTWRLCRLGHTGKSRWERRTRTSTSRVRAGDAADYISSQGLGRSPERLWRIELQCPPRRGGALPLSYSRTSCVDRAGFEPAISRLRAWRDDHYSNGPLCTP
jgi:hypothetical protein